MSLLKKGVSGELIRPGPRDWNAVVDAARTQLAGPGQPADAPLSGRFTGLVKAHNTTGDNWPRFAAVALYDILISPADNLSEFQRCGMLGRVATPGDLAESPQRVGISLTGQPAGTIGDVQVSGVVPCRVDMQTEAHRFAGLTEGETYLTSDTDEGPVEILWVESGTGEKWALVRLGGANSAGGGSTVPDYSYTVSGKTNLSVQVAKGRKFWANGIGWTPTPPDAGTVHDSDFTLVRENYLPGSLPALSFRENVDLDLVDVRAKSWSIYTSLGSARYAVRFGPWAGSTSFGSSFVWSTTGADPATGEGGAGSVYAHVVKITADFEAFSGDDLAFADGTFSPPRGGGIWHSCQGHYYSECGYSVGDGSGAKFDGVFNSLQYKDHGGSNREAIFFGGICVDTGA